MVRFLQWDNALAIVLWMHRVLAVWWIIRGIRCRRWWCVKLLSSIVVCSLFSIQCKFTLRHSSRFEAVGLEFEVAVMLVSLICVSSDSASLLRVRAALALFWMRLLVDGGSQSHEPVTSSRWTTLPFLSYWYPIEEDSNNVYIAWNWCPINPMTTQSTNALLVFMRKLWVLGTVWRFPNTDSISTALLWFIKMRRVLPFKPCSSSPRSALCAHHSM